MNKAHAGWQLFTKLCKKAKDEQTFNLLFALFLTPEEKESVSTRTLIIKDLLNQVKTQREMSKDLGVSIAKITRGSNELKRIERKLLLYLQENCK